MDGRWSTNYNIHGQDCCAVPAQPYIIENLAHEFTGIFYINVYNLLASIQQVDVRVIIMSFLTSMASRCTIFSIESYVIAKGIRVLC